MGAVQAAQGVAGLVAAGIVGTKGLGNKLTTNPNKLNKMFRNARGHFPTNTAGNRALITRTANAPENYLGTDARGSQWFAQTRPDGSQVWAKVRNGIITEAGLNQAPKPFHPETGLNPPQPPRSGR